jgi:hypothetical protein
MRPPRRAGSPWHNYADFARRLLGFLSLFYEIRVGANAPICSCARLHHAENDVLENYINGKAKIAQAACLFIFERLCVNLIQSVGLAKSFLLGSLLGVNSWERPAVVDFPKLVTSSRFWPLK